MKTYTTEQRLARVITGGIFPSKLNITSPDGNDTGYLELDSVTATGSPPDYGALPLRVRCGDIALHGEAACGSQNTTPQPQAERQHNSLPGRQRPDNHTRCKTASRRNHQATK